MVGGKNASRGEMIQTLSEAGIRVPGGFATTADAYVNPDEYEVFKPLLATPPPGGQVSPRETRAQTWDVG